MKKIVIFIIYGTCCIFSIKVNAQQGILKYVKVYFTQPVDNTYSNNGINAVQLNNSVFDTLAAYINRAKYTVDLAQYEYETYTGDPIATAINNAYSRGVKVRYIQDGNEAATNSGVKLLNASIPLLSSPVKNGSACNGEQYNIMHNKFVVIDEFSPDTTQAIVWTGSPDWDANMSSGDYNNVIIFQSKVLARAFTNEFDIMWGDTTHGGAAGTGKFGSCKPNSGTHVFHIGGSEVELYFSPTDSTNNHIIDEIKSAKKDLYCGMNDFSETTDATDIVNEKNAGVSAYAILDSYSSAGTTPFTTTLPNGLGSNFTPYTNANYLYHNKFLIVNPSAPCDNPVVLTGSHNWTASADAENDENTVIVHNDTIANLYLQSFANDFKVISGTAVTKITNPCTTGINSIDNSGSQLDVYPNPYNGNATINYTLTQDTKVTISVYNIMGEKVATLLSDITLEAGQHTFQFNGNAAGIYILQVIEGNHIYTRKLVQE
ncbi:MAG TPA: phospholipase D-like domain-containing protein [Bacteroidia bacterium]|nr:phospholipase D-like domain-containing protein [Bacteroidia bacterium]